MRLLNSNELKHVAAGNRFDPILAALTSPITAVMYLIYESKKEKLEKLENFKR